MLPASTSRGQLPFTMEPLMNKSTMMWKFSAGSGLALILALAGSVPAAFGQKIERDPTISPYAVRPKAAPAKPLPPPNLPKLTAAQIVDKNVAARGGLAQ